MKKINNLYEKISSFDNIHLAYLKARKCKRYRKDVLQFSINLEENLISIHNELIHEMYKPGRYREFYVTDPKRRLVLALPFRDRVVHHALCNVITGIFDKTFIDDSYACREKKGAQSGINRADKFIHRILAYNKDVFCLKMDVRKYFYSINHDVLKRLIRRKIKCKKTLKLTDIIIDSTDNPGIPIGNLTSQLFANIYLSGLDRFIKETLRAKYYIRYMDDMVIMHSDKNKLKAYLKEIEVFIDGLHLSLNNKTSIFPIRQGLDFLGYRQFAGNRILRKSTFKKNFKKLRKFTKIEISTERLFGAINSFAGIISHCKSDRIIHKVKLLLGEKLSWELAISKNRVRKMSLQGICRTMLKLIKKQRRQYAKSILQTMKPSFTELL